MAADGANAGPECEDGSGAGSANSDSEDTIGECRQSPSVVYENGKRGPKSSSKAAAKARRANVQAELRNLHSQWCTLLGGRATVKSDKKPAEKQFLIKKANNGSKGSVSGSTNPLKRKVGRPRKISNSQISESHSALSITPNLVDSVPKEGQPSDKKLPRSRKHKATDRNFDKSSEFCQQYVPSLPSLDVQEPNLDQRGKSEPLIEALEARPPEGKTLTLKRMKRETRPPQLLEASDWAPGPSTLIVGVHKPSTELLDRLEDPPICTICDDGGDLIWHVPKLCHKHSIFIVCWKFRPSCIKIEVIEPDMLKSSGVRCFKLQIFTLID
jgi:hypothetical protein